MESNNYITLCLIDSFAWTRSADNEISYHCFAENCMFETANLGVFLDHFDGHKGKWFGYCYACNVQIHDEQVLRMKELEHWNSCHRDKIGISVVFQSDDRQNKLREAVDVARAKRFGSDNQPEDELNVICLKPWSNATTKTQENCSEMLSRMCLYALYKCMDRNCAFFTSCDQAMLIHLESHENCAAAVSELSWLECAYCDRISDTRSSLVQHIREEHGSSAYQCPYCFYRSCTACNVIFHLKTFHKSRRNSVLVCCAEKLHQVEKIVVEENRSKNVFALRCSDVCNEVTYLMQHFINHLKAAHDNLFKCQFCGSNVLISEAIQHLSLHNIGVYQCIDCVYGTNDITSIHNHMCHSHPTRLPFICVRLPRKNRILCDDELPSVESTLISNLSQVVRTKWLKMCPFTSEELLNHPLGQLSSANTNPPLEFSKSSSLIDNNPSFDGQDILTYDDLKRDYSCDDWHDYFTTNRLQLLPHNDDMSEIQMDIDEGFESHNNTEISQRDRTEPDVYEKNISNSNLKSFGSESPVLDSVQRKGTKRDGVLSISDACISHTKPQRLTRKSVTINSYTDKPVEPKLSDVFGYRCAYCPKPFMNPRLVYDHWKKVHVKPRAAFMFQIIKIFMCCHCRRHCQIYDDLKRHCEQKHATKTFAIIDKMNERKCALCSIEFCNASTELIVDHFKEQHSVAGLNNTIRLESYLTDEWLEKIIAEKTFERSPGSGQIMYDCPYCPSARLSDQLEMVAHIRKHFLRFRCGSRSCDKTFDRIEMLQKHQAIVHGKDETLSVVNATENLGNYLEMKIIFPNGLMLTKRECVNTRFGATDDLVRMVKELNESDMAITDGNEALMQQTQSEQISQPKSPIRRSKATTTKRKLSPVESNLSATAKSGGCSDIDHVDRKRLRPRLPKGVQGKSERPTANASYGITTRRNRNNK